MRLAARRLVRIGRGRGAGGSGPGFFGLCAGEAVRFSFRPDGAERIVCRVLDFDRKTVREAALKAGEELRLDTLENGYYDLEFEAFDAAGKRTGRGSWPFAVIPEVDRSKLDWTRNQFGAMVMPHTAYPLADRKRDAEMMSRIGIRFVRTQRLSWIQIQPDENRPPDWTMSDRETEIYLDNHLAIVANTGWPLQLWVSSGRGSGMRNPDKMFPAGDRMEQLKSFYTELASAIAAGSLTGRSATKLTRRSSGSAARRMPPPGIKTRS